MNINFLIMMGYIFIIALLTLNVDFLIVIGYIAIIVVLVQISNKTEDSIILSFMTGLITSFMMFVTLKLLNPTINISDTYTGLISFLTWLISFPISHKIPIILRTIEEYT